MHSLKCKVTVLRYIEYFLSEKKIIKEPAEVLDMQMAVVQLDPASLSLKLAIVMNAVTVKEPAAMTYKI